MPFRKFSYDSNTLALMGHAYDSAINDLKHSDVSVTEMIKSAIAMCILEAVDAGERDANRLLQCALAGANRLKTIMGAFGDVEAFRGEQLSGTLN